MSRQALDGVRILDLSMVFAGPYATKLLADMGAEVIKVESCTRCDQTRGSLTGKTGAYPEGIPGEKPYDRAAYFTELNRNKYGVTIDLTHPAGRDVLKRLVALSDVVFENFSARVMKSLGLDYANLCAIKPDLIMVSMNGYGMTGPYRDYVSYGTGIEAMTLSSDLTGYRDGPPLKPGIAYGDPTGGLFAAFGVLAALRSRNRTGLGRYIDLSLRESLIQMFAGAVMDYTMNRRVQTRQGNRHSFMAPHGCYRCKGNDHWIAIAISKDGEWQALCQVMNDPALAEDGRFADALSRWRSQDVLDPIIEEWTSGQDRYEAMYMLQKVGVPAVAVLDMAAILADPQYTARGYFPTLTHPAIGEYPYPGISWKMDKTPGRVHRPAPRFAEHNDYVFSTLLGLSADERDALKAAQVIGDEPVVQ